MSQWLRDEQIDLFCTFEAWICMPSTWDIYAMTINLPLTFRKNFMHYICSPAKLALSPKYPYLIFKAWADLSMLITDYWFRWIITACLPVFGYERFDAVDFSLLISLLLRTQSLLGVRFNVTLRNEHFVRHRKLRNSHQTRNTYLAHLVQMNGFLNWHRKFHFCANNIITLISIYCAGRLCHILGV